MTRPLKERLASVREFWGKPIDGKRSRVKRSINPDGPEALARIEELERLLSAAAGRAQDYRTVAINQGWNWKLCDAYGRETYAQHRGEHVDACALNAAEARARAALNDEA